jgi:uncharacterized protein (TIGR03437 family)
MISSIDLGTGREMQLTGGFSIGGPVFSADGNTVFFTDRNQLYSIGIDGSGLRQTGPTDASLVSGDGTVAYSLANGLSRIDLDTSKSTQLSPEAALITNAARVYPPYTSIAAIGSVTTLLGPGLNYTRQLTFCGQPVAFTIVNLWVRFQVPWDAPEGPCQTVVQTDSLFEDGLNLEVRTYAPEFFLADSPIFYHLGMSGVVTQTAPAHPGEVIVGYMTGLGPVDSGGQITRSGFTCVLGSVPADIQYAGLAPGYPGFYQINFTVPNVPYGSTPVSCGWRDVSAHGSLWVGP